MTPRGRKVLITLAVLVVAGFAYFHWFVPANQPGASPAYQACGIALIQKIPQAVEPSGGDVTYTGSRDAWTITGNYHLVGEGNDVGFSCTATLTGGRYSAVLAYP